MTLRRPMLRTGLGLVAIGALVALTLSPAIAATPRYDITTLAGKVASLHGTAGHQVRFSAFLEDLERSGLLKTTLVVATGEFGRTPKIGQKVQNDMTEKTGRDHWPHAFTALLAGGGVKGGQVIGKTDAKGMGPDGDGMTPEQVASSFYHGLGIDAKKEYQTDSGRPVQVVRGGGVIGGLFG